MCSVILMLFNIDFKAMIATSQLSLRIPELKKDRKSQEAVTKPVGHYAETVKSNFNSWREHLARWNASIATR